MNQNTKNNIVVLQRPQLIIMIPRNWLKDNCRIHVHCTKCLIDVRLESLKSFEILPEIHQKSVQKIESRLQKTSWSWLHWSTMHLLYSKTQMNYPPLSPLPLLFLMSVWWLWKNVSLETLASIFISCRLACLSTFQVAWALCLQTSCWIFLLKHFAENTIYGLKTRHPWLT